jgi:hypothetical protein
MPEESLVVKDVVFWGIGPWSGAFRMTLPCCRSPAPKKKPSRDSWLAKCKPELSPIFTFISEMPKRRFALALVSFFRTLQFADNQFCASDAGNALA